MRKSRDAAAAFDLDRAEAALKRRRAEGSRFASVAASLQFYYARRHQLQTPQSPAPRVAQTYYGQTVAQPQVDGGRGNQLEDVLATLLSVHEGLIALNRDDPTSARVLELVHQDGLPNSKVGHLLGASPATISAWRNSGEMYLLGWLRMAGIIV